MSSQPRRAYLRLKRGMDLVLGSLALVPALPVLGLVAVLIRLDSPGPALFRQVRIGWKQRPFRMWKLRTMVHGAPDDLHREYVTPLVRAGRASRPGEPSGGSIYKVPDDPRVTRVGRWLRRTSLDELPQLFNVLRGEMSLVGPRPIVTYEHDAYEPWQLARFDVPQGMTGLWQVSGRSVVSYRRMCEMDIDYVRRRSLWLDLRILLRTPWAVLSHREPALGGAPDEQTYQERPAPGTTASR
jgi:lipopolysaccharide/colanic/teichoic acid biosynthesis glycosyltransferase